MSKKRKRAHPVQSAKPKDAVVWRQSAGEATLAAKPRYNGFACGHGGCQRWAVGVLRQRA